MSKLTLIFSSVLGIPEDQVTATLSPENTSSWDSLNAIILLSEIEKTFETRFAYDQAMSIKNFGDVLALVKAVGKDPYV